MLLQKVYLAQPEQLIQLNSMIYAVKERFFKVMYTLVSLTLESVNDICTKVKIHKNFFL